MITLVGKVICMLGFELDGTKLSLAQVEKT